MTEEEMKALIADLQGEKEALKTKNAELLGKNKQFKADIQTLTTDKEDALETASRNAGDVAALEKQLSTKYQNLIDASNGRADTAEKQLRAYQVDSTINGAFAKANLLPDAVDMVRGHFASQVEFNDGVPHIGAEPLDVAISAYLKSDKAKPFLAAAQNSGVGPKLGTGASAAPVNEKWSFDTWQKIKASDPAAAAAFAKNNGHGYLSGQ